MGFEPTVRSSRTTVFKTAPINRSGTPPCLCFYNKPNSLSCKVLLYIIFSSIILHIICAIIICISWILHTLLLGIFIVYSHILSIVFFLIPPVNPIVFKPNLFAPSIAFIIFLDSPDVENAQNISPLSPKASI